jgi:hypothetical protein
MEQLDLGFWTGISDTGMGERQMQMTIRIWESYERKERQKRLKPC